MYSLLPTNPGVASTIAELLESRRARFNYVSKRKNGRLTPSSVPILLLNTLGSCLGIPVLFFISFHALTLYLALNINPYSLLSVLFIGVFTTLLFDVLIGLLYDKLIKQGLYGIKVLLSITGTVCQVIALAYLFRPDTDPADAIKQFRAAILTLSVTYTLCNATTFKNTANLTPSQEDRSRSIFGEYFLKASIIIFYVSLPYWIRFYENDCECGQVCSLSPGAAVCLDCVNLCDRVLNLTLYQKVTIGFTVTFGVANILVELLAKPRTDEEFEDVPTTFNRRIAEVSRNKLLVRSFFINFLQHFFLFGFAFWINYYLDYRTTALERCTRFWGTAVYFCSKSWMKQLAMLFIVLTTFIIYLASRKRNVTRLASTEMSLTVLIAGILLITFGFNQSVKFFFTILLFSFFFVSIPANKLLYTNGMFFDEYFAGVTHPYFPSALYHMTVKLAFFIALAFNFTVFDPRNEPGNLDVTQINSEALGAFFIIGSFVILALNFMINKYELHAFDKIHVAIERNFTNIVESLSFNDPVDKKPIRRPVVSQEPYERHLITLLYNLGPRGDLKLAIAGKYGFIQSNGLIRMVICAVLLIGFTAITIIFGKYLDGAWGWLVLVGLVILPISLFGFIYNFNVWQTAGELDSAKNHGAERSLFLRFVPLLEDRGQPQSQAQGPIESQERSNYERTSFERTSYERTGYGRFDNDRL